MRLVDNIFNSMVGKSESSPYTYYDYLESDGNEQYIDTGVIFNGQTTAITIERMMYSAGGLIFPYGASDEAALSVLSVSRSCYCLVHTNNRTYLPYGGSGYNVVSFASSRTNDALFSLDVASGATQMTYTLAKIGTSTTFVATQNQQSFTTAKPLTLFAVNLRNGVVPSDVSLKMGNVKIYDSDVLVRDFRPAVRIADGVAGMHDVVNDVFYTNANPSGDNFLYGNLT